MHVLWRLEKAFLKDVLANFEEEKPHYNTLSTIIRNLEDKGYVTYNGFGKTHQFYPIITKETYKKRFINTAIENYFNNSYRNVVSFFAKEEKISVEDLKEIIAIIEKKEEHGLFKTSISSQQLALTNNFYNSQIKRRIVMLQASKSKKINAMKYTFILPLLAIFIFIFNTEVVAQTSTPKPEEVKIGQNVLNYLITKNTNDKQLQSIKDKMADQEVTIEFKELKRNDKKEITDLRIEYDSKKGSGEFYVNSDDPIKDIAIRLNVNENKLFVGQAMKNLSQSFEIINDEDGNKKVNTSGTNSNVFVYSTDEDDTDETVSLIGKDGDEHQVKKDKNVYVFKSASVKKSSEADDVVFVKKNKNDTVWIKQDVKNIVWTDDDGEDVEIITGEKDDNKMKIFTNGEKQPIILLNGKEVSNDDISNLKPEEIESVNVFKGNEALNKYGPKGKDGVIYIKMKDNNASLHGAHYTIAVGEETNDESSFVSVYSENSSNEESISYTITKSSTEMLMDTFKSSLKNAKVDVKFSKIKRNKYGEILSIKISLEDKDGHKTSETWKSDDETIPNIAFGKKGEKLFIKSIERY